MLYCVIYTVLHCILKKEEKKETTVLLCDGCSPRCQAYKVDICVENVLPESTVRMPRFFSSVSQRNRQEDRIDMIDGEEKCLHPILTGIVKCVHPISTGIVKCIHPISTGIVKCMHPISTGIVQCVHPISTGIVKCVHPISTGIVFSSVINSEVLAICSFSIFPVALHYGS